MFRKVWASWPIFLMSMKLLLGKKLNMTQLYSEKGDVVPVTIVKVGKGAVTQVKNKDRDGYTAVQLAFGVGSKNVTKPVAGHVKGLVSRPKIREMRVEDSSKFEVGQKYDISSFSEGEKVSVSGTSKGKGLAGVVKRHGFSGADASHGTKHHERAPGSIGATDAARVFPGKKMPGHMGAERVTITNLEIAKIDAKVGLVMIKGAIPGARNGIVEIRGEGDMTVDNADSVDSADKKEKKEGEEKKDSKE